MPRRAIIAICLLMLAPPVQAQSTSALINEALDKLVEKLDLNTALPEAVKAIENQTGVPIKIDPAVWDLLPWGEQTNINAKIENRTLREAMTAITQKLGLTFVLKDEYVELQPMAPLRRLARRATVQELKALDLLARTPLALPQNAPTMAELLKAVDGKLESSQTPFAIENRTQDEALAGKSLSVPRNASLMEALETIPNQTSATWYPWGKTILIVPKQDQVRNQLARTLTLRYNGVDVNQVLSELQQRSGVDFAIEPGAIQRIPPEFRNIRLDLYNASIQQALENLAGFTGLGYVVNENGVYLWNQQSTPGVTSGRDPMIGLITLPDLGIEVMVPQSQVPADLRDYIRSKTQQELEKYRRMMEQENFKPTTQPAQDENPPGKDL